MAGESDIAVMDGQFKDVYGGISDVRPSSSVLQRLFKFEADAKLGDEYKQDICLRLPSNRTYTGVTTTVSSLNSFAAGNNGIYLQAASKSYEVITRDRVQYKALSQASVAGKPAFEKASSTVVNAINTSASLALEISLLRGQYGLGEIESITDNTTNADVVLTADTWCTGLWYSLLGAYIDSMTTTTVNNAGLLYVSAVTPSTRTVRLEATGTVASDLTVGDVLYPKGSHGTTPKDFAGLIAQARNTSGSMLGLSASTYPNWAGNTYSAGGPISWRVLEDALHPLRSRAPEAAAEGFIALAGRAYGSLAAELQESGRMELNSGGNKSIKAGVRHINYQTHSLGDVDLAFHPLMSDGQILIVPKSEVKRPGASDLSFQIPGFEEKFMVLVADTNAVEFQCLCDQTVMLLRPSCATHITGITY
jgi:hypothetical protein